MISRRAFLHASGLFALLAASSPVAAGTVSAPAATIESFYGTLLAVMKDGQKLGFIGRREELAPAIEKAYDLPLMTQLMVGPPWQKLSPAEQRQLIDAFSNFSIATYSNRFDDFSGESFEVDPNPVPAPNNDVIIHTKLVRPNDAPVQLDYLLRNNAGAWQIVDVYLSGTVSELATRRSEFSSVLRRGGPGALVDLLKKKAAELSG
jgi:phospholipid transport system substrate-binding protein